MVTLQRLLAVSVIDALRSREHVRIAAGSLDALRDEIELSIAPTLPSITPYLMAAHAAVEPRGFGDRNAEEAVASMVDVVADRLMESNHLDDIFADDAILRRDTLRALRGVLLRYLRGELEIEDDTVREGSYAVALDGLGYVVATAAAHGQEKIVRRALSAAARRTGAVLESYHPAERKAVFLPRSAAAGLLALEEAIAEEMTRLVELGRVEMPSVDELLEIPAELARLSITYDALLSSAMRFGQRACCIARCQRSGKGVVRVSLTPLSLEAAERAEQLFAELCASLEDALDELLGGKPREHAPQSAERAIPPSGAKSVEPASNKRSKTQRRSSAPASSRRAAAKRQAKR